MSLSLFHPDLFVPFHDEFHHPLAFPHVGHMKMPEMRSLPIDVIEDEKAFTVKADLPGVKKEDVHVKAKDGVLTISVESKDEKTEEKKDKETGKVFYHSLERSSRFMSRSIKMPKAADLKKCTASLTDGVLSLSVPKSEALLKDDGDRIAIA